MAKMEGILRAEISRLARKEIRAAVGPLARSVRELKRAVAKLTKKANSLAKAVGQAVKAKAAEKVKLEAAPGELKSARFSAGLIRKLRRRLGVTQAELAKLANVSPTTVAFWEQGRHRPTEANKVPLVALRKLGRREVRRLLGDAPKA